MAAQRRQRAAEQFGQQLLGEVVERRTGAFAHGFEQVFFVGEVPVHAPRVTPAALAMSASEVLDTPRWSNSCSAASSRSLRVCSGFGFGAAHGVGSGLGGSGAMGADCRMNRRCWGDPGDLCHGNKHMAWRRVGGRKFVFTYILTRVCKIGILRVSSILLI